jgi:hypothetical protein
MDNKSNIVIYGLSTEGYVIASNLAKTNVDVTLIDEKLQVATEITADTVKNYSSAKDLMENESLLGILPLDQVLSNSQIIFVTPKLRKNSEDSKTELISIFSKIAQTIKKNSILFNCVPQGLGINNEIIEIIKRNSGLDVGDFTYVYSPLFARTSTSLSLGVVPISNNKHVEKLLKQSNIKFEQIVDVELSERIYTNRILNTHANLSIQFETFKNSVKVNSKEDTFQIFNTEIYIDDLLDGIHDVKQINYSLDSGLPLHYISSGIIRNVEGSIRVIVDKIKQKIKDEKLKPSRTKIILFWRIDEFEIRGDKIMMLEKFISKLEDIVGDVQILTDFSIRRNISQSTFSREKHNFVLLCSKADYNYVNKHKNTIPPNSILVKANELLDIIQNK